MKLKQKTLTPKKKKIDGPKVRSYVFWTSK